MRLALFDLDNTLLPLDSDYEWARFLVRVGAVDEAVQQEANDRFMREYKAGVLDIFEFLAFQLAPLARYPMSRLRAWHDQYMDSVIRPAIHPRARALVDRHRDEGDLCAVVTATNEFVTAPIARAFGVDHLVATRIEQVDGRYTGRPRGTPCFQHGKVDNTECWLRGQGLALDDFERSYFYSDSANDLPLMARVTDPIATNPDPKLGAHASAAGWPILHLFE